ncbi:MAG: hypothetical protein L6R37_005173 [Teloschistes peruensis]|nr:MAG: hypothetical protein L6R37_005173 [Teloschistes peruensis]
MPAPLLEAHASQIAWDINHLDKQLEGKSIEDRCTICFEVFVKSCARAERERILERAFKAHLEIRDNNNDDMPGPMERHSRKIRKYNLKIWAFSLRQGFLPLEALYKEYLPSVWGEPLLDAFLELPAGCDMLQLRTGLRHAILARLEEHRTYNDALSTNAVLQECDIKAFRRSHYLMQEKWVKHALKYVD